VSWVDPWGLDTVVVVNNNGVGHVGVWFGTFRNVPVGKALMGTVYDPGGSFFLNGGDFAEGDLRDYVQYQRDDGPDVSIHVFRTTSEQEKEILSNITNTATCAAGACVICTVAALDGVGPFSFRFVFTPWGMRDALRELPKYKE
jgi:hypothetical protein